MLKQQNARLKAQDAGVQTALEDSRRMLRDMEADGLLAKGTADTKPEQLGSCEGRAAEVKKTVLGQDAFVDSVVRAIDVYKRQAQHQHRRRQHHPVHCAQPRKAHGGQPVLAAFHGGQQTLSLIHI